MKKKKVVFSFGPPTPLSDLMATVEPASHPAAHYPQEYLGQWVQEADRPASPPFYPNPPVAGDLLHAHRLAMAQRGQPYPPEDRELADLQARMRRLAVQEEIIRSQASRDRQNLISRTEEMAVTAGTAAQLTERLRALRDNLRTIEQGGQIYHRCRALIDLVEQRLRDIGHLTIQQEIQAIQDAPWPGEQETHHIIDALLHEFESLQRGSSEYIRKEAILNAWEQKHAVWRHAEPYPGQTHRTAAEVRTVGPAGAYPAQIVSQQFADSWQRALERYAAGSTFEAAAAPTPSRPAVQEPTLRSLKPLPRAIIQEEQV